VTVEQNWNLSTIPNLDGDGSQWDSWMLPFGKLQKATKSEHACANMAC
jgi:hypothetical protein